MDLESFYAVPGSCARVRNLPAAPARDPCSRSVYARAAGGFLRPTIAAIVVPRAGDLPSKRIPSNVRHPATPSHEPARARKRSGFALSPELRRVKLKSAPHGRQPAGRPEPRRKWGCSAKRVTFARSLLLPVTTRFWRRRGTLAVIPRMHCSACSNTIQSSSIRGRSAKMRDLISPHGIGKVGEDRSSILPEP